MIDRTKAAAGREYTAVVERLKSGDGSIAEARAFLGPLYETALRQAAIDLRAGR